MTVHRVAIRSLPTTLLLAVTLGGLLACGSESSAPSGTPDVASPASSEGLNFAGTYKVSGITIEKQSGTQREISGTIILVQEGDEYTSTFDLNTVIPSPDGPLHTAVIGKGEGKIQGKVLSGTARTQLVISAVPGIDAGFAFAPRSVGARIVSKSVARLEDDGTLTVEIETDPESPDQRYPPTRTTLRGSYVSKISPIGR